MALTAEARTFLTFQGGDGNAALELYESVFDDFSLISIQRFGEQDAAPTGTIKHATFRLAGHELACSDSAIEHGWGFTPAISLYIECDDEPEQQRIFDRLADGGQVYMPLGAYGFSTRFGWVGDRFGVTWQLNLA